MARKKSVTPPRTAPSSVKIAALRQAQAKERDRVAGMTESDWLRMERDKVIAPLAAKTVAEVREMLRSTSSSGRAACLLRLLQLDDSADAWRTVGLEWSDCDNITSMWRQEFDAIFREYRNAHGFPIDDAMDADSRAVYDALPPVATVYRGCYDYNVHGLSWTLDRVLAMHFPLLDRYWRRGHAPLLVKGSVRRANIAFLTVGRNETEVVIPWRSVRVKAPEPLRGIADVAALSPELKKRLFPGED